MNRTRTGEIPGHLCPHCAAPLLVINKNMDRVTYGRNTQFVGCSNYHVTGCNYRAPLTENIKQIMDRVQAEADLVPAEF